MEIVLATNNDDKVVEIKELLNDLDVEVLTLKDFPNIPEIIEDGKTLKQNAFKKAKTVFDSTGLFSLGDDTGLEVDALNGQPGVYSSRFAGENVTYDDNVNKLLNEMSNVPDGQRKARFRCVISLVGSGFTDYAEGVCEGEIIKERRGNSGFGYDPVFLVPRFNKTFAEMELDLKNEISHRGLALKKAKEILKRLF